MTQKIKVPAEMIAAGFAELSAGERQGQPPAYATFLRGALRWLSENPVVPTDEQATQVEESILVRRDHLHHLIMFATNWQRRMFLSPEEELPAEVKALLDETQVSRMGISYESAQEAVAKAYRLGLQRGRER